MAVVEFLDYLAADFSGGAGDDYAHASLTRLPSFLIPTSLQNWHQRFENRS
jgi:hypothetical protein